MKNKLINIPNNLKELFENILSNDFYNKIMTKMNINKNKFDEKKTNILLFILRFILLSIKANNNNLFSSLLIKSKSTKIIKDSYLPGISSPRNSLFKEQLKAVEKHLKTKKANEGAYVCSCGYFYDVAPCGFPTQISKCFYCNQPTGGENHKLVRREGHYRIFLDIKGRESQLKKGYADKDMPNMLLKEYEEYVDKMENKRINEKEQKLDLIKKEEFVKIIENNLIRNMDNLTYRIINFILYSHIFYANILEILSNEDIKCLLIEDMDLFTILENDWDSIQQLIKDKNNIKDMREFMNIIYHIIENKIVNCNEIFDKKEQRNLFEKEINDLIQLSLNEDNNEFKTLKSNYEKSLNNLNLNKKSLLSIINEEYPPTDQEYINDPLFKNLKYFMLSDCPNIDLLKHNLENIKDHYKKYPLLNKILNERQQIELLQNLPNINQLSNLFLQKYSYNIKRNDAKDKKLSIEQTNIINELFNGDEEKFKKLIENYTKSWNNIKDIAVKYSCKDEMNPHEIKNYEDEYLANFLVDDGEIYYGMYLAAAYQNFIYLENNFIKSITNIDDDEDDTIHKNYFKQLNYKIRVQDANKKDIPKICTNEQLQDYINECSIRKCFDKDGIVIYNNYEGINIDIDKIEEKLCELVLLGVKDFKDDISFIVYRYEGYRGKNTEILTNYIEKYNPQRKLIPEEINAIFDYIENDELKSKVENTKKTEFLFDLQKIINYIQNENFKNEHNINEIISKMPQIMNLGNIKEFFKINDKLSEDNKTHLFTVNSLVDLYNLFEHLCWEDIKNNINNEYKKKIEEEKVNQINDYFTEIEKDEKKIIKRLNLSTAIRRYISKYLSGQRGDNEINENQQLILQLKRADLWDYLFVEHPFFENEMDQLNNIFKFTLGEVMDLYEKLGTDDKILQDIKNLVTKNNKKIEDNLKINQQIKQDISTSSTKEKGKEKDKTKDKTDIKKSKTKKKREKC